MAKTKVKVNLAEERGNTFAVLGKVLVGLKSAGHKELAEQYVKEATTRDYNHVVAVTSEYVEIEWDDKSISGVRYGREG